MFTNPSFAFACSTFLMAAAFLIQPWLPLGDWRWPFVGLLGSIPWMVIYRREIARRLAESAARWRWPHYVFGAGAIALSAILVWQLTPPRPLTEQEQLEQGVMGRPLSTHEQETGRIMLTPDEDMALTKMRMLVGFGERLDDMNDPQWASNLPMALALSEQLNRQGLAPVSGHGFGDQTFNRMAWRHYLSEITPYLEQYGMERALHETRRYNGEVGVGE